MIIIGITGTLGAGKGSIVNYLVNQKGFVHFSVRAFITEEIIKQGLTVNRDSMFLVANNLRALYGSGYIAEQLYKQAINSGKNCIIESIRTPGEVELLKSKGNFFLFAVDAEPQMRYNRISSRASETDHISYDTFVENENREMDSDDPNKQNLRKCISLADYVFINSSSFAELHKDIEIVLNQISLL